MRSNHIQMRPFLIIWMITCFTISAFGQYPFEKASAIKYKKYQNWQVNKSAGVNAGYSIVIPHFYPGKHSLKFQITPETGKDSSIIQIHKAGKLLQSFIEPFSITVEGGPAPQSAFVEDVNGDGLSDLKVLIPNNACCGAYNYYLQVVYLFQNKNGTFTKISFSDLMMGNENRPERDIDGDGNFEIITQTFQNYGDHNYWLFNLYNFDGNGLANVNIKQDYPIMVQLLYKNNYKITDKVSRTKMKRFARKLPNDYDKK